MSIEIKNISKNFGGTCALDRVTLSLGDNKIYGLLGNNGAGKSTLLSILTNRLYPGGGSVTVDGQPVANNDQALGKIFLVSEKNMFPDDMRVKSALDAVAHFYPAFDRAYAEKLADKFRLDTKQKIKALSTGYGSIFRLILGLSVNTPYLLFDEPVLGLDARHRDMFYRTLMEKYTEKPCTVLISTHLIAEAAELIEHAVIIRNGRILRDCPGEELLSGAYAVSGPSALVDSYIEGKRVLSINTVGGLKTAALQGERDALPAGLEVSRINLQDYFISLMEEEDKK
ncbi:MAG: ABC transporter ATP-binding protein [Oscillospiraceae bacterium]|jgi:ABC-2 type transport system ATP-binding protein|nr:ABC transporter ATP-binding protein [Oscillospiraceae bacterium]